jgi:hypothetical protein
VAQLRLLLWALAEVAAIQAAAVVRLVVPQL